MRKVIYIAGCGYSGSTILEMLLTTTRKAVGLGEIWMVVDESPERRTRQRICSCGVSALDCEFWGPVIARMQSSGDLTRAGRYRLVLDRVEELFGSDVTVVDSSKKPENLTALATDVQGVDLAVVHNIRDVRPHSISMMDTRKVQGPGFGQKLPERIFYRWYKVNRVTQAAALRLLGRPPVQVTHESLCLSTEGATRRLAESLGDEYIDLGAVLSSGITHNINGNRVRLPKNAGRARTLVYDYQWLMRPEWLRPYVLLPKVRTYNEHCLRQSYGPQGPGK